MAVNTIESYQAWRESLEKGAGVQLTKEFCEERAEALSDASSDHVKRFAELYGEAHLADVISWYRRAAAEAQG